MKEGNYSNVTFVIITLDKSVNCNGATVHESKKQLQCGICNAEFTSKQMIK